jgi:WD40 repeat protein
VAFAPDGKEVAAATDAGTVRTWEAGSGEPRLTLRGPGKVLGSLAYSADGRRLAAAVGAWTIKSGNPVHRFFPSGYDKLPGEVVVWDGHSGEEVARLSDLGQAALCVALAPDGRSVVAGGVGGDLRCWDVAKKGSGWRVTTAHREAVFAVAFSPDGRSLATGGWDGNIRFWDPTSGAAGRTIATGNSPVLSLTFTPKGGALISGSFDRLCRRWDPSSGLETGRALGHTWAVTAVGHDRTGQAWSAGWDKDVHLWPASLSPGVETVAAAAYTLSFAPSGRRLAVTSSGEVAVYDADTRRAEKTFPLPGDTDLTVAYSPDGRVLVAAGITGVVHRWRADDYTALPPLTGHRTKVWGLAFSPDGKNLASAAGMWNVPGEVRVWDPHAGRLLHEHDPKSMTVRSIAFTPDGGSLLYGVGEHIGRLDATTWSLRPPLPGLFHVAVAPDGQTAALGQATQETFDQAVFTLMDLRTEQVRARIRGHTADIYQVTFTPDSRTLATASWDGTVKLWHVATGEEMLTFRRSVGVVWFVTFSPDGRRMAIAAGRGPRELSFWDARPPEQP